LLGECLKLPKIGILLSINKSVRINDNKDEQLEVKDCLCKMSLMMMKVYLRWLALEKPQLHSQQFDKVAIRELAKSGNLNLD
jgi:hypothetical protein